MCSKSTTENDNILLSIFEQNWSHIRHVENERMLCLNAYVAILAATIYVFSATKLTPFAPYLLSFLLMFSVINFLLALKIEAVIEDYTRRNKQIVNKLQVGDVAGLRVESGIWKLIRFRYIFPCFYAIICVVLLVYLTASLVG